MCAFVIGRRGRLFESTGARTSEINHKYVFFSRAILNSNFRPALPTFNALYTSAYYRTDSKYHIDFRENWLKKKGLAVLMVIDLAARYSNASSDRIMQAETDVIKIRGLVVNSEDSDSEELPKATEKFPKVPEKLRNEVISIIDAAGDSMLAIQNLQSLSTLQLRVEFAEFVFSCLFPF